MAGVVERTGTRACTGIGGVVCRLFAGILCTTATTAAAQPELIIEPAPVTLQGPLARQQLIATARDGAGRVRDVTAMAEFRSQAPDVVAVEPTGVLLPRRDGSAPVVVRYAGQAAELTVEVRGMAEPRRVSFRHEVVAALGKAGCNAGTCHGSPNGKNGFRLSLRGFDPELDYVSLTRDVFSRRVNAEEPETSLMLLKPLGAVPHGGGRRFDRSGRVYAMLRDWLAAGMPNDPPEHPARQRLEVLPPRRELQGEADRQQLVVLAHFANGRVSDVTDLAVFSCSDERVAVVSENGLVERKGIGEAAVLVRYLDKLATAQVAFLPEAVPEWSTPRAHNFIDELVFAKLKRLGIEPSPLASDAEFARRAALDTIGTVMPPEEVRAFLDPADSQPTGHKRGADTGPSGRAALSEGETRRQLENRARLIDRLLERPEYAEFWALKWSDVLRAGRPNMALSEVIKFQGWLRDRIAENTPFDQLARELLTATGTPYDNPAVLYFRAGDTPAEWSEQTAQVFLGIRMQCAKCHNHPFERWTRDDYYGLAAFFARLKHNPKRPENRYAESEGWWLGRAGEQIDPRTSQPAKPRVPGVGALEIPDGADRRTVLMDWLARPDNPYCARAAVNRIWYHLMGRGIVEPVDDFRDSNPPSSAELLDALAADFVAHGYDVKHLIRTILTSRTYQLSAEPTASNIGDTKHFSHALPRLLSAEQLLDSISAATGVQESFDGLPLGIRAAAVPDIEVNHMFLKAFGLPERLSSCACERTQETSFSAALQLINGESIQRQLRASGGRIDHMIEAQLSPAQMVEELFLAALNRYPNQTECAALVPLVESATDRRKELQHVLWALINTREFQYRH